MIVVLDASAVVDYLLRGRSSVLREIFRASGNHLHVPALCDVEIAAVLRRLLSGGELSDGRTAESLRDYLDLPLRRHGHDALLERMLQLRGNFSVYDATYVALAERLGGGLATLDEKLTGAVRRHLDLELVTPG